MADGLVTPAGSGAASRSGHVRLLVLRAWLEPGGPPQLRVRIVEIGSGRGEQPMVVTTSVDEACRVVRTWLETPQARGAGDNSDGTVTQRGETCSED
jgi:hypothetical protein